ncbi:30S ribosomal protein S11 [Candidatus Jorgensenbacteria bacterium GWA1_54_12]|uniref:Small ribosomal subunit protein uS11 n=1 Tax=Candidatus Jorgensenbacteria bacterium GWA1_54_12 TaxID=1798468 RepID=A0A1F6BMB2_9BACT|nr:MAG: 30S ribosomal protein S11 [Candidatus Jorgensenbacteria bacterium GWA1_54_12]
MAERQAAQVGKTTRTQAVRGRIYIRASYNNTSVTVTDETGNVIAWMSAGSLGFSGPKKSTPFAASKVVEAITEKLAKSGLTEVEVFAKGVGSGRDAALRALAAQNLQITSISDVTPIPHNGPRPRKSRRV